MKNRKYLILTLIMLVGLSNSCSVLDPEQDNIYTEDNVQNTVTFAEGILLKAYRNLPTSHESFALSYGCDDAVINTPTSSVKVAVSGGWTADANPFSVWSNSYESIFYINSFLEEMTAVNWYPKNEAVSKLFAEKLKGEAYALRAWNYFNLLQAHAGLGANGEMLGVPIVDKVIKEGSDYKIPRASFNNLVKFIIEDCDKAIAILPGRWINTSNSSANIAIGDRNTNRINGQVARLIKTKTLLYAASPAYSDGTYTYQMAAESAAQLMNDNNGLTTFGTTKVKFYGDPLVPAGKNSHPDVIWYSSNQTSVNSWEMTNFSPSQYGKGQTNPTQELVNAFPMLDGTPTPASKINSSDPYSGRDPRLKEYIMYNGSLYRNVPLNTKSGAQDALGSTDVLATKTGYYLKKFMNVATINLDPTVNSKGSRYYTYARYTDALLMFAEAANEVGGPDATIGGYTARQVINDIRKRAGINSTLYVNGLNKADMTNLIRNERRIEMCFENQRFWDLRRWKMTSTINQPVSGVNVSADGMVYTYVNVELRNFADKPIYGPIPFGETLKYNIVQNKGW